MVIKKKKLKLELSKNETVTPKMAKKRAAGTGSLPEAIGLFFLKGWSWSLGKSTISLIKYTEELTIVKMKTHQSTAKKL